MLAAIVGASRSIYLEMYIFEGDTKGYDFLAEIETKAREGVRVIVILDALGSFGLATEAIERLRTAGAEIRFFSYWLHRTHRKLLIVDEAIVFLGGVNISSKFARWRDLQVRVTGGRIAHLAVLSFAKIYRECGGHDPALSVWREPRIVRKARAWFLESGLGERFGKLRAHYADHIERAEKSVVMITPYLTPPPWLVSRLHRAIMRNVKVTLIIPKHTDSPTIDRINYYHAMQFEKIGAACLLSPSMNHAKAMLIDDTLGTVGTHNLDTLSFDWNIEAGIFFDDKNMVGRLRKIMTSWIAEAVPFPSETYSPKWYDIILVFILRIFQRTP